MKVTNQVSYDITPIELEDILIKHFKIDIGKNITELKYDIQEDDNEGVWQVLNISLTIKNKA